MGFLLYDIEVSSKLLFIISIFVIIILYFLVYNMTSTQSFKANNVSVGSVNNINIDSIRPSFSVKAKTVDQKIWDSNDTNQVETWPNELTTLDLKIEPFHGKKSVGFK